MASVFGFLGPLSSGSPDGIEPLAFALISLFAVFVILGNFRLHLRRKHIYRNAETAGYAYLGDGLPADLPLGDSSLQNVTRIENVFGGEARGKWFVFFECALARISHGPAVLLGKGNQSHFSELL
jgi:hypothetical protein